MRTVFIGGSRRVGRLNGVVREKLDSIVERGLHVVVGDANGSDRAVQGFLAEKRYRDVVVYCMENACRNNVGGWPVRAVEAAGKRGFEYYALKDAEMARDADCGLMIWDGKSKGTLLNVHRLVKSGKPVVVYFSPSRECRTIKTRDDLRVLVSKCPQSERRRLSSLLDLGPDQATLFPALEHALPKQQM